MPNPLLTGIDWGTQLSSNNVAYYFQGDSAGHSSPFGTVPTAFWSEYEIQQVGLAFSVFESITNLNFTEVFSESSADVVLMNTSDIYMVDGALGVAGPPGEPNAGEVLFNYQGTGWDWTAAGAGGLEQGGYGFVTIIHELGHILGLAHPHDGGGSSTVFPGVSAPFDDYGDFDLNQGIYTTMSYNDGWQTGPNGLPPFGGAYGYQGTMMAFDIAVLQAKYGANMSYHSGANTYVLRNVNDVGTFYSCIWDAGGTDQIVYNGAAAAIIDLRAATLVLGPGAGGWVSYVNGVHGGFTIANGVVIENARGGSGNDTITGNAAANLLMGGGGSDTLIGGVGRDTLNGGTGRDFFDYNGKTESVAGTNRDIIQHFSHGEDDTIDLRTIDAVAGGINNAFRFIGADTFAHYKATHAGVYGMVRVTSGNLVQIDIGGNRTVDMEITVTGSHLVASDFLL